jgi:multimeric flavodoxin WrbA
MLPKGAGPDIEVELIDLGGLKINGDLAAGIPLAAGERDDFPKIEARMREPNVGGIIIGTPVYFSNMSSLCKVFLDRWMAGPDRSYEVTPSRYAPLLGPIAKNWHKNATAPGLSPAPRRIATS